MADGLTQKETSFKIKFNYKNLTYQYSFAFLQNRITKENLKIIKKTTEKVYFSRTNQVFDVLPPKLKSIAESTKQNTLFLYNAQQSNDQNAINVLKWFADDLVFVDDEQIPDHLINLMKHKDIKDEFLRFLRFADFNIVDVTVREVPTPKFPEQVSQILNIINPNAKLPVSSQQLNAVHKKFNNDGDVVGTQEIPLSLESRGTQKKYF
ncbi:AAA family ATPase [Paucilactobacillus hokkaidonensis]|uniref:AAA family ATPase n=1 Tax=Paucilactobacillus hokkaidonensis TaxID=1193095 RepID=UPI0006D0813F|nr:hypothetical protein [Paucilactobacillus hokkaidonensis]